VEQLFTAVYVMEFYIDADGQLRAGNRVLKATIGLFCTDCGEFVYHAPWTARAATLDRVATSRQENDRKHRRSLRHLESLQRGDLFKSNQYSLKKIPP